MRTESECEEMHQCKKTGPEKEQRKSDNNQRTQYCLELKSLLRNVFKQNVIMMCGDFFLTKNI